LIWNQVRFPQGVRIDNAAMIAATKLGEQRVIALLDRYGKDTVMACIDEMFDRTERAVRAEIVKIPDGTYSGEAATDDDGTELDVPVWVRADVTVTGDHLTIDLSRSDKQRKGFVNSVYAATYGNAIAAVCMTLDPALADYHNQGTQRAITVIAPEGLVVNCKYPCTVGASPVNVGNQTMESVLEALSKARPERAAAAWGKHRGDYVFAVDPRTNERYVRTSFDYDGGGGAEWGYDGYQGLSAITALGSVNRGNIEEMETRIPWRMTKWEYQADLTGAGRWRGGPGIYWEAMHYGTDAGMATGSSDGDEMLGFGALGGEPSPPCRTYIKRGDELIRIKPHRMTKMKDNDIVVKYSSGGGGVGPAWQRDPEMVRLDVKKELVSLEAARDTYKVVLDPVTLEIDWEKTNELRAAMQG
ncbi:MAG: hydantoinase B/oxoprolinase family protein, partial [Chloroflexi bacterium]|nr:hydantoinase B/oxoprolinase family protein [Chloroflexota bacterium]